MTPALARPLNEAPDVGHEVARSMLDDALDLIEVGVYDVEVRSWVDFADPAYVATLASWLRRSWAAGVEVGRAEREQEAATYHQQVREAREALDRITGRQT